MRLIPKQGGQKQCLPLACFCVKGWNFKWTTAKATLFVIDFFLDLQQEALKRNKTNVASHNKAASESLGFWYISTHVRLDFASEPAVPVCLK